VFQSPTGQFLENIAVQSSSKLLITSVLSPTLYTLDPTAANAILDEVYAFPNANGLTGITEYRPDVYAIVASELNVPSTMAAPGSVVIWSLDLTSGGAPAPRRAARIPQSTLTNGLSTVPGHHDLVLAADSILGAAYEVNVRTSTVRVLMRWLRVRRVGLRLRSASTECTFALACSISRVPQPGAYDDFTFDSEGRAWVATNPGAVTLFTRLKNGTWEQEIAVGDAAGSTVLNEPSSAAFGRGGSAGNENSVHDDENGADRSCRYQR
ncbi:hypothetical protein DFH09DRAFT_917181, partial [Mycena vulgaris]